MTVGSKVLYDGKEYIIVHIYQSGYCEIRDTAFRFNVKLVSKQELTTGSLRSN
jgi:hypothetical protein